MSNEIKVETFEASLSELYHLDHCVEVLPHILFLEEQKLESVKKKYINDIKDEYVTFMLYNKISDEFNEMTCTLAEYYFHYDDWHNAIVIA